MNRNPKRIPIRGYVLIGYDRDGNKVYWSSLYRFWTEHSRMAHLYSTHRQATLGAAKQEERRQRSGMDGWIPPTIRIEQAEARPG